MLSHARSLGDSPRGFDLHRVPLPIAEAEGVDGKAFALRDREDRCRIKAAAQKNDGRVSVGSAGCCFHGWLSVKVTHPPAAFAAESMADQIQRVTVLARITSRQKPKRRKERM